VWPTTISLGLLGVTVLATLALDAPAHRYMEREINRRLTGYTVSVGALHIHPWTLQDAASASDLLLGVRKEDSMTIPHDLLNDLRSSPTDLARIVEAVVRDGLPYVVIPDQAVRSWECRAPDHWAKVAGWLAAQNVAVVQI